jgi:hypothetical protein
MVGPRASAWDDKVRAFTAMLEEVDQLGMALDDDPRRSHRLEGPSEAHRLDLITNPLLGSQEHRASLQRRLYDWRLDPPRGPPLKVSPTFLVSPLKEE